MTTKETGGGSTRRTKIWSIDDAQNNFNALFEAAGNHGPQIIRDKNREFTLSLTSSLDSPLGRAILQRGGPLENEDELE